ncbi:uncharacterized protein LOC120289781 [Eucalyptus grandis]|uniref:uncharacterized protein LOC120289781 n=1 Tax=Eucalyptus grandis TaxID=71139 RepID=UPI00192EEEF2|nr:uncharacterized protein LOC120289781 [Eucalyptus grandis]
MEKERMMGKKSREVPVEWKEQVQRIKEVLPNCTEEEIYEALEDCKMDSDAAAQRLLSQVEREKRRESIPMEVMEKVERIKKKVPRFGKELICEMLKQCNMDSSLAIRRLLSQGFCEPLQSVLVLGLVVRDIAMPSSKRHPFLLCSDLT